MRSASASSRWNNRSVYLVISNTGDVVDVFWSCAVAAIEEIANALDTEEADNPDDMPMIGRAA